jgi:hypothetical protein
MEELAVVAAVTGVTTNKTADTLHWFSAAEEAIKALLSFAPNRG